MLRCEECLVETGEAIGWLPVLYTPSEKVGGASLQCAVQFGKPVRMGPAIVVREREILACGCSDACVSGCGRAFPRRVANHAKPWSILGPAFLEYRHLRMISIVHDNDLKAIRPDPLHA